MKRPLLAATAPAPAVRDLHRSSLDGKGPGSTAALPGTPHNL